LKPDVKNIAASVKRRLQNKAKESNRPFSELLQYYGMERFLYRFSRSEYAKSFILKGALMFTVWDVPERRATVDIDFLARVDNQIEKIEQAMREVCNVEVPADGLVFDAKSVKGQRIKEDADYEGVRVKFLGFLEKSKLPMQTDVGFGDAIVPKPSRIDYPTILNFPPPHLQGYTFESVVAEKFETMVKLGLLNSRMKDFYDIWLMSRQINFDGRRLAKAIKATFECRKTPLPAEAPLFAKEIYDEKSDRAAMWRAFLRKKQIETAPDSLTEIAQTIESFLLELVQSIATDAETIIKWQAPGPWR
jgi:hypothetical protein